MATAVETAQAAEGDLAFDRCLAKTLAGGCSVPANLALNGANGIAISPDGRSVYVTSEFSDSISHFFRSGPQQPFTYDGCIAETNAESCLAPMGIALDGARGVAVSPDGDSVYVASSNSDSLSHFFRTDEGQLTYGGCVAQTNAEGCEAPMGIAVDGASGLAMGPDGASVYVASENSDSISRFAVAGPQGQVTYKECVAHAATGNCTVPAAIALDGAREVAVSPDGGSIYAASRLSSSISHFRRAGAGGEIAYQGCVADGGATCVVPPTAALLSARALVVSPDGTSIYVASPGSDSVSHFSRAPDGTFAYRSCKANTDIEGCEALPGSPLSGVRGVAVSPDGASVYATSSNSDSISLFRRTGAEGQIAFGECEASPGVAGCEPLAATAALDGAHSAAVSPDGASVYVAAEEADSISHFFRSGPPDPPPPPPPDPPRDTAPPGTAITKGPKGTTTARTANFRFSSSEPGSRFQCRLDRQKRWTSCGSPRRLKNLRPGRHTFRVRAIDAAGNVDPTPAQRRWKVTDSRR